MPKIIEDVEERIFNAAFNLFAEKGYNKVNMKMVAKEAGIAVGTLYNYFPNKLGLFLSVLETNFEKTFEKLNKLLKDPENSIYDLIEILYDESSKIKEMSKEIIRTNILGEQENEVIENIKNRLVKMLGEFLVQLKKEKELKIPEAREKRLIHLLLLSIIDFSKEFPCEREDNISFINEIFWALAEL